MGNRPKILLTMRLELETGRFYLGRDYSEAVETAGGVPLHCALIPNREYISQALDAVDGVLLPGSNTDVDPHHYGEGPHRNLGTVIPEKDDTDQMVLEEAEKQGMPVFGICYGMQALNVFRGGTLIQDIHSQVDNALKHEQGPPATRASHALTIEQDSLLSSLETVRTSVGPIRVNSSHHQAIGKLGRGLRAIAWTSDGIVECILDENPDRFVLGVQWHPELTAKSDGISGELFELFVRHCAEYKKQSGPPIATSA